MGSGRSEIVRKMVLLDYWSEEPVADWLRQYCSSCLEINGQFEEERALPSLGYRKEVGLEGWRRDLHGLLVLACG